VLVTSWTEVFSLTALNAAACAVPLITSHGGYHAEHFGSVPYYVDPADTHAIRAAIIQAIEERESRREDRLALAYRLREEYRWEAVASKTLKAYRALVGQS
jgi:glycosyltransferase involved in cell wall biosynthesis